MSNTDETGGGDNSPRKTRSISQAPPPVTPLPRGSYLPPSGSSPERCAPDRERNIWRVRTEAEQAIINLRTAIEKGWSVKRVDAERWQSEIGPRWSQILRPAANDALAACERAGVDDTTVRAMRKQLETLDREWKLVCRRRENISATNPPSRTTSGSLQEAIARRLNKRENPGSSVPWKDFCNSIRDECGGWIDKKQDHKKRGYSDKVISRVVKRLRGQIGRQTDI
jgi:hypothetical protein